MLRQTSLRLGLLCGSLLLVSAGCGFGVQNNADASPRSDASSAPEVMNPCGFPAFLCNEASVDAPVAPQDTGRIDWFDDASTPTPDAPSWDAPTPPPWDGGGADTGSDTSRVDSALGDVVRPDADLGDAGLAETSAPDAGAPEAGEAGATFTDASLGDYCALLPSHDPYTLYLSADDSNSMASPVIVRRLLWNGHLPPKSLVRPWEFLNYYNVPYAPAAAGTLRVVPQLTAGVFPATYAFQVGVQSEARTVAQMPPLALTLVLDTSESMSPVTRVGRMRAAVTALAQNLRAGDRVNVVTWALTHTVELEDYAVTGPDDPTVPRVANLVTLTSATDLHSGLVAGYDLARAHYRPGALNRVILVSDGEANAGVTDVARIAEEARRAEGEELYLAGISVGDGFSDTLFNAVTDAGRGAYVYLDDENEARRMLGQRFVEVLDVAQRSVRLELTLPWYMRVLQSSAEAVSGDPRAVDPQHLAPNDSMVFYQTLRACSASIAADADPVTVTATFEHPFTHTPDAVTVRTTLGALRAGTLAELHRGAAIAQFAQTLQDLEGYVSSGRYAAAHAALVGARAAVTLARRDADDAALQELALLVDRADALVP